MSDTREAKINSLVAAGCSTEFAERFADSDVSPPEALRLQGLGLDVHDLGKIRETRMTPEVYKEWLSLLGLPSNVVAAHRLGLSLDETRRIFDGLVGVEHSVVLRLIEDGCALDEIALLREANVSFHRTYFPSGNTRGTLLNELFGSELVRRAWECAESTIRMARVAQVKGDTPYSYVTKRNERPRCVWVKQARTYDFAENTLPECFRRHLQNRRDDAFLRAVGYVVGERDLEKEFLELIRPQIVLRAKGKQRRRVRVAFTKDSDVWTARMFTNEGHTDWQFEGSDLADVGVAALEEIDRHAAKADNLKLVTKNGAVTSECLAAAAQWFADCSDDDLPTVDNREVGRLHLLDGRAILFPVKLIPSGRPGVDRIERFGDVVVRVVGAGNSPICLVSVGSDDEIREATAEAARLRGTNAAALVRTRRYYAESDDVEPTTQEEMMSSDEIRRLIADPTSTLDVNLGEVLEMWIDERVLAVDQIVERLRLASQKMEGRDAADDVITLLYDVDFLYWELFDNDFNPALVLVNGVPYLTFKALPDEFFEMDPADAVRPELKLKNELGYYGFIEEDSRTSGWMYRRLGLLREGLLISEVDDDDFGRTQQIFECPPTDYGAHFAQWLFDVEEGGSTAAYLFLEQQFGELPDNGEVTADWLIDDWSSTLILELNYSLDESDLARAIEVLEHTPAGREYLLAIRNPESPQGRERLKRQEKYYEMHPRARRGENDARDRD